MLKTPLHTSTYAWSDLAAIPISPRSRTRRSFCSVAYTVSLLDWTHTADEQ